MQTELFSTNTKPSQAKRLLLLLKDRGLRGATNIELNDAIGFRYGARIYELRQQGYDIERKHLGGAKWLFFLKNERELGDVN